MLSAEEASLPASNTTDAACFNDASFLFSIDLEDVRSMVPDGERYQERVPRNMDRYLEFFSRHQMNVTFFTVGDVARRYPAMIGDLVAMGHEVACHTSDHLTLDQHTPESLRVDLKRNLDDLAAAGADQVRGFRAPMFSLTQDTAWAYEQLAALGLTYSSSVLPAAHPHYGWPGFPSEPHWVKPGIWEIPVSLLNVPGLRVPIAGGVYLRILPFAVIRRMCLRLFKSGNPVVGYLHPFDIDTEQERFVHPRLNGNRFHNWLMYLNRGNVLGRLERLIELGARIRTYQEFVDTQLSLDLRARREVP